MRGVGWTELGVEVVPGPVCQSTLLSSWWTRKYERGRMDGVGCGGCPWTRMSVYSTKFLVDKEV